MSDPSPRTDPFERLFENSGASSLPGARILSACKGTYRVGSAGEEESDRYPSPIMPEVCNSTGVKVLVKSKTADVSENDYDLSSTLSPVVLFVTAAAVIHTNENSGKIMRSKRSMLYRQFIRSDKSTGADKPS